MEIVGQVNSDTLIQNIATLVGDLGSILQKRKRLILALAQTQ